MTSHRSAGRLRLRVPGRRNDYPYFARVVDALAQCAGVREVTANELTAGILLLHDGPVEAIHRFAAEHGLFVVDQVEEMLPPLLEQIAGRMSDIDRVVARASRGEIDLRSVAFLALAALGGVQALRGNVAVPAVTGLWYAADLVARAALAARRDAGGRDDGGRSR